MTLSRLSAPMIWLLVLALGALGEPASTALSASGAAATISRAPTVVQSSPTVPPLLGRPELPTESRGENVRRDPPFRDPTNTFGGSAAGPEPLGPNSGSLAHQVDLMMESHNLMETPSSTTATPRAATLLEYKFAQPNSSGGVAVLAPGNSVCNISLQCPTCTSPDTQHLGDFYKTDLVANTQPVYAHETQTDIYLYRSSVVRNWHVSSNYTSNIAMFYSTSSPFTSGPAQWY